MWFNVIDDNLFPLMNGSDNLYLDSVMATFTSAYTWIPLYLSLVFLVIRNNETMRQILMILFFAVVAVLLSGGIDDAIIKPLVMRIRPLNEPLLGLSVDTVNGVTEKSFSFFSAHSANTFAIATFIGLLVRSNMLTCIMYGWAMLNAITRVYLGVHYPTDILVGMVWGIFSAFIAYGIFYRIYKNISSSRNYVSSQYTVTGYSYIDMDVVASVFFLILCIAALPLNEIYHNVINYIN